MSNNGDNLYSVLKILLPVILVSAIFFVYIVYFTNDTPPRITKIGTNGVEFEYSKIDSTFKSKETNERTKIGPSKEDRKTATLKESAFDSSEEGQIERKGMIFYVVDSVSNKPIPNANIFIPHLNFKSETNSAGEFIIPETILVQHESYESFTLYINQADYNEKRFVIGLSQSQTFSLSKL